MFGTYFYNETIKRCVSVFGTCFNNLTYKKIKGDGTVLAENRVPISYGPGHAYLRRLREEPDLSDKNRTAISLPRMAFQLMGFTYDQQRQQNKLIKTNKTTLETTGTSRKFQYAPAPYDLEFELSILAYNQNDALQIIEQILPYFQPEYTVTMKMIDDLTEVRDVPIVLTGVSMNDDYEGDFETRRTIEYTMNFTMKTYFFGPIYTGNIIRNVIERDYINDSSGQFTTSQIDQSGLVKEVKHYEPAFGELCNPVENSQTITFPTAINSKISVNDEVFYTGYEGTNPTVSSIADDRLSITINQNVTIDSAKTLMFVGSVDPSDTFVVAEQVSFSNEAGFTTYAEDKVSDAS